MIYHYQLNYSMEKATALKLTWPEHYILSFAIQFFNSGNAEKKVANNKNYYWLAYSFICECCEPIQVGVERMRQIMNRMCDIGVFEKLEENSSPRKHYAINYSAVMDCDDDIIIVPGTDNSLPFYLPREKRENHFSTIKFNNKVFTYFTPAIETSIILNKKELFDNNFIFKLKKLLSVQVFKYFKNSKVTINKDTIVVNHNAPIGVVKDNYYKLERALVDSYITIAFSATEASILAPKKPSTELIEFRKLFKNLRIDTDLKPEHDINILSTKVKESTYLQGFSRLSDILRKYNEIIADKYKDFEVFEKKKDYPCKKPIQKRIYTEEYMNTWFDKIEDL